MRILNSSDENISKYIDKPLLQDSPEVEEAVRAIIADVKARGDEAVLEYVRKFDCPDASSFEVPAEAIRQAYSLVPKKLLSAIETAARNIESFHKRQIRESWVDQSQSGKVLGQIIGPVDRAAVLVPGSQAPLPSSVLMGAVPAKVAGVREVFVSTPPQKDGSVHPAILVAASESGVDKVFAIGGAHGVAALAFGTESIPRVDKIVGPGNIYVTMAKRFVYGQVGIDMLAGPSEVLIIADCEANPAFIAADLLSQAEHTDARAILVTDSAEIAEKVSEEVDRQLAGLNRAETARKSLEESGAIIVVPSIEEAVELANRAAPEHLELMVRESTRLLESIKNAGAVFFGDWSPEPMGDYVAGTNHVLPTSGTARFSSALGLDDFIKKTSVVVYSREALEAEGPAAIELAEAEGLDAHANAVKIRLEAGS